jgi:hypothetical protein
MNWLRFAGGLVILVGLPVLMLPQSENQPRKSDSPRFVHQELESQFGIGYAVTTADVNRDGKVDIIRHQSDPGSLV